MNSPIRADEQAEAAAATMPRPGFAANHALAVLVIVSFVTLAATRRSFKRYIP